MPCPSSSVPSDFGVEVRDLLEVHPFDAHVRFRPSNKAELVRAVISSGSSSLRALGSSYSLSEAGDADNVVSTDLLNLHLSQPLGALHALPANRIRPGVDFLEGIRRLDPRVASSHFVHVEAGVKVKDLLHDLRGCGLDLATSGAGGGQSLAGALSTGTHGADFRVPVLVDWIRAAHLVSSAGQEFWITSTDSPFGGPGSVVAPDACPDAEVIADNSVLNAVRVGVGRFGVVYSLVLEVVPAYGLLEIYFEHAWPDLRSALASSAVTSRAPSGAFDVPLSDLESGWVQFETRSRTVVKYSSMTPSANDAIDMDYVGGPARNQAPVSASLEPSLYGAMLTELGLAPLAASLRGGKPKQMHHMNIAISLVQSERCWVSRRWQVPPALPKVLQPLVSRPKDILQTVVEAPENNRKPTALIGPLRDLLDPDLGTLGGKWLPRFANFLGISDQAKRIFEFRDNDLPRICERHEQAGATIGEALFLTLYKLATDATLRPDSTIAVAAAVSQLIAGDTVSKLLRCGLANEILDTHNYALDGAQSGNSAEYFFDTSAGAHMRFVDSVIALANAHAPILGYMGIRFMPESSALLGMPKFPLTASVEIATARSRVEDVYAAFWTALHALANASAGLAHWGQEFRQSQNDVAARFGQDLKSWRLALGRVAGAVPTFSTKFSRQHGLEPDGVSIADDEDAIDRYLAGLHSADP